MVELDTDRSAAVLAQTTEETQGIFNSSADRTRRSHVADWPTMTVSPDGIERMICTCMALNGYAIDEDGQSPSPIRQVLAFAGTIARSKSFKTGSALPEITKQSLRHSPERKPGMMEEERRLLHVACTQTKQHLSLSLCRERQNSHRKSSIFISKLGNTRIQQKEIYG